MSLTPASSPTSLVPPEMDAIFSRKPLLPNEDETAYDAALGQLIVGLNPRDAVEYLFVKDIADAAWEIQRTWTLESDAVLAAVPETVLALVKQVEGTPVLVLLHEENDTNRTILATVRQALYGRGGQRRFQKLLAHHGIPAAAVQTAAYQRAFAFIEKLHAIRVAAERRKEKALRQFEQRRMIHEAHRRSLGSPQRQGPPTITASDNS